MSISTHLSVINLSVNEINSPIIRHRVAEWIKAEQKQKKQDPSIYCLQEITLD